MKVVVSLLIVIVLLLGLLVSLPFLVDLNKYQDQYKPLIEQVLNRKVQLEDIRLTIWPRIGARVAGFTILDDPSFSSAPFASLTSLDIGVKLLPLLSKRIEVEEITLRGPVITVIKNTAGIMNVSTIGQQGSAPSPVTESRSTTLPVGGPLQALALLAVEHVAIEGGKLTYRDLSTAPTTEYEVLNLEVLLKSVHLGETPTLHAGATVQPYNLPITLDGSFGPLVESLDISQYDLVLRFGEATVNLNGSFLGGLIDATLTSPGFNTADLPVILPLQKAVQIKDLRVIAKAAYPFKESNSPLDLADVSNLVLRLVMGNSAVDIKGTIINGQANVTASSPLVNTADLPVAVPLAKPVEIRDLTLTAKTRVPFNSTAPPLEMADVPELRMAVVIGPSVLNMKGTVKNGQAVVVIKSPSVNTADLPVETGLKKAVEIKNLDVSADLKGQDARLSNLSFQLFDGETRARGGLSLGTATPPFNGKATIQGMHVGKALEAVSPDSKISLSGTAALTLTVAGRGFSFPDLSKSLEGTGRFEVKDGKIEGVNLIEEAINLLKVAGIPIDQAKATVFSTIETDFLIKQGVVTVRRLLLDSHDFQASGHGNVGFDQTLNLALNLTLSQSLSRSVIKSSPIAKIALSNGRLRLPFRITGSMQNPSYGLDMKSLTGKAQEQVQKKIEDTVEGLIQGTTKPSDLENEGRELLKGLLGR